jgi:hypothetical protein
MQGHIRCLAGSAEIRNSDLGAKERSTFSTQRQISSLQLSCDGGFLSFVRLEIGSPRCSGVARDHVVLPGSGNSRSVAAVLGQVTWVSLFNLDSRRCDITANARGLMLCKQIGHCPTSHGFRFLLIDPHLFRSILLPPDLLPCLGNRTVGFLNSDALDQTTFDNNPISSDPSSTQVRRRHLQAQGTCVSAMTSPNQFRFDSDPFFSQPSSMEVLMQIRNRKASHAAEPGCEA